MQNQVIRLINQTNQNIFLTGKAGTGKTTLLRKIMEVTHKNTVITAPTGIAAINAGGVTIHSMFQLPFASFLPTLSNPPIVSGNTRFENRISLRKHFKMHENKQKIIKNMELLVVDEVSMLRADVLDAMDFVLQSIRKNKKPFGGVQVLFIGDLLQLPPVVRNEEWEILKNYYKGMFFFQSNVISENPLLYIELEKVYRQSDIVFINLLNNLRNNALTQENFQLLASRVQPNFDKNTENQHITLTTHNVKAEAINQLEMSKLAGNEYSYQASIVGDFPEHMYPIEKQIFLKIGARVMFVKNDLSGEKLFFNGKMGTVVSLGNEEVTVQLDEGKKINVEQYEWENIRYKINSETKEIEEERLGTFTQYPLRLAWAITVHKSQGLTFEKAILDLDNVFAAGQAYVAFSRLRSLDGLVLLAPMREHSIENDYEIRQYAKQKATPENIVNICESASYDFLKLTLLDCFDWSEYQKLWILHKNSYVTDTEQSKKSIYKNWAAKQCEIVTDFVSISVKFSQQISQIFAENYDFDFLFERFEKAYFYFLPRLEEIWFEVLLVVNQVVSIKKTKQFQAELSQMEEATSYIIRLLLKGYQMMKLHKNKLDFDKENINYSDLKLIKEKLILRVKEQLKNTQLIVNEEVIINSESQKKEKKTTYDTTFELWQKTPSVSFIAQNRMLTENTVYRHLIYLVDKNKISISEILPKETIDELSIIFENSEDIALGAIYEKCNGKYTWDELRMFKTYYQKES